MTLEQIRQNLFLLINKANKAGAFELEEAGAALQTLAYLDQHIAKSKQVTTMDADDGNGVGHDPSKP